MFRSSATSSLRPSSAHPPRAVAPALPASEAPRQTLSEQKRFFRYEHSGEPPARIFSSAPNLETTQRVRLTVLAAEQDQSEMQSAALSCSPTTPEVPPALPASSYLTASRIWFATSSFQSF